jgi:hypothetical protein
MFGRVAPSTAERGQFFLFYSSAGIAGGAVLVALVSGRAGVAFEQARRRPQRLRRDAERRDICCAAVAFLLAVCLLAAFSARCMGPLACGRQQPVQRVKTTRRGRGSAVSMQQLVSPDCVTGSASERSGQSACRRVVTPPRDRARAGPGGGVRGAGHALAAPGVRPPGHRRAGPCAGARHARGRRAPCEHARAAPRRAGVARPRPAAPGARPAGQPQGRGPGSPAAKALGAPAWRGPRLAGSRPRERARGRQRLSYGVRVG